VIALPGWNCATGTWDGADTRRDLDRCRIVGGLLTLGPRSLPWLTQKLIRNGQRLAATLTSCNVSKRMVRETW
jgi:hypothetical protein